MRIEWQVVALSAVALWAAACVPAGSKTSDDTTDEGSGGGSTDTEVTVEECYPGNLSREVSECLIEAGGDGYLGLDEWDSVRWSAAGDLRDDCNTSEYRALGDAWADAHDETAACWEACADGDDCAAYFRTYATCTREYYDCAATAHERYGCDVRNVDYAAATYRCADERDTCMQAVSGMAVGCTF